MIWLMTTNSNICRIYEYNMHPAASLTLVTEINHPENKMKKGDFFTSDKPGHYHTNVAAHGTYSSPTDPKEVEFENFAREIAAALDKGRNTQAYKTLIVVAAPHMYGLLSKHLNKQVKDFMKNTIQKDVVQLSQHELLKFLEENVDIP